MPTKEEFDFAAGEISQKQVGEQVLDIFGTQKPRFDVRCIKILIDKAKGLEAAKIIVEKDPLAILRGAEAAKKDIPGRAAEDAVVAGAEKMRDATRARQ